MEKKQFTDYLQQTNQLSKVSHMSSDGMPNMKYKYVRDLYHEYLLQQTPTFECHICMENIDDNMCKLKCGHKFCVDCFSNLSRTSNKCPLCRSELSKNKVNKKKLDHDDLNDIVNFQFDSVYTERNNMDMYDFIYEEINKLIKNNSHSDKNLTHATDTIAMEVLDSLHTVAYITMEAATDNDV